MTVGRIVDTFTGNFKSERKWWRTKYYVQIERRQEGWIPIPLYTQVPWGEEGKVWRDWVEVTPMRLEKIIGKLAGMECE